MMANISEMTVTDFERVLIDASVEEVIKIMHAVKSVTRDRTIHKMNDEGNREFVRTMDECIYKLENVVNKYIKT